MNKTQIPELTFSNNLKIPVLGLGTWKLTGQECINAVKTALELGYNHIDTAFIYHNENEVKEGINSVEGFDRKNVFITSKLWPDKNHTYEDVIRECDDSLKRLETDYLDLYLMHWPIRGADYKEIFRAFKTLVDEGKARSIGVSNFTIHHLQDVLPIAKELSLPIVVNEIEFHPGLYQKGLLEFCNENKIAVIAYSPLAHGEIGTEKILNEIAEKYSKTPFQVSMKWLLQHNMIVIPKAAAKKHIEDNMKLFDFELSEDEMKQIDSMGNDNRVINPPIADFDY